VDAARYPTRAPARANALLIVRVTTRLAYAGSSSRALGVPSRRNSAYASSTTTTASSAAPQTASTVSRGTLAPVGLLGEARKTTWGRRSAMAERASAASTANESERGLVTQRVEVALAYSGYME
jgi:hypothetical protein